ncbi:hypothetical protein D3C80_2192730 [compost metagenome]
MSTLLYNPPILHDDKIVGVPQGRQPVGNGNGGAAANKRFQCLLNFQFRLGIQ